MVTLMLEDDGCKPAYDFRRTLAAHRVGVTDSSSTPAGDDATQAGNGQATLRTPYNRAGKAVNMDIGITLERLAGLVEALDADQTAVYPDLGGSYSDPVLGRVRNRAEHEAHKSLHLGGAYCSFGKIRAGRAEDCAVRRHDGDVHYGIGLRDDLPFACSPRAAGAERKDGRRKAENK